MYGYEKVQIPLGIRVYTALAVILSLFGLLVLRLWYLQILKGEHFRVLSENNRRKTVYMPPPRGIITDRNGEVLVRNRPAFNIEFVAADSPNPGATIKLLSEVVGEEESVLKEKLAKAGRRRRFEPKVILKDVSRDTVARVAAKSYALPGVVINHFPARDYLYDDFASHIIGYIREITREQLENPRYAGYQRGDLVGQYGVEMQWERDLHGQRGARDVVVNVQGVSLGELSSRSAVRGNGVMLTLNRDVQLAADRALNGKMGAIVALDPHSGEVIAMSSSPRFDPNIFTGEVTSKQWAALTAGDNPMSNRAVQGAFPPGSVFKAVMGAAGFTEGVMGKNEKVYCPGFLKFGSRRYHCHRRSGHGGVTLHNAIVMSCDVYFYVLGQRLGVDRIHKYASQFGLGKRTGLELVPENPGLVPSTTWKAKRFKGTEQEKWWPGETLSVAIGQGAMMSTPLQMANAIAAIVNGGKVYKPRIVKAVLTPEGGVLYDEFPRQEISSLKVEPSTLQYIQNALKGVVNEPRGTGRRSKVSKELDVVVAGKTGTSQVVALSAKTKDKKFEHHAWFVGYAPADDPKIVVSALVEHGGGGGTAAAPLVSQVLEAYFRSERGLPQLEPVDDKVKVGA